MHARELARILDAHARFVPSPLAPEVSAFAVDDPVPLWEAIERATGARIDTPYFAVAWPGAQAIARVLLDGAVDARGARVVDLACGSALALVAAARAGAARAVGVDIDPLAIACAHLVVERNHVACDLRVYDAFATSLDEADLVLVGDLASRAAHAPHLSALYARALASGARLVVADSGRPFFVEPPVPEIARFVVAVSPALEGVEARTVRVFAGKRDHLRAPVETIDRELADDGAG